MGFIDQMRAEGHAVESIIRVLLGGRPGAFGVLLRDAQGGLGLRPKIT